MRTKILALLLAIFTASISVPIPSADAQVGALARAGKKAAEAAARRAEAAKASEAARRAGAERREAIGKLDDYISLADKLLNPPSTPGRELPIDDDEYDAEEEDDN